MHRGRMSVVLLASLLAACLIAPDATISPSPRPASTPLATGRPSSSPAATSTPRPLASVSPTPATAHLLTDLIEPAALGAHLEALQAIADANGGHRATGTRGHEASAVYVSATLAAAGYAVEHRPFETGGVPGLNLLVERPGDRAGVVMIGAHLDSVRAGPGINDNGSGVAAALAIAVQLATLSAPRRTIRIAFWDAEEGGSHGSRGYVEGLSEVEREDIVAYLNLDIIGSPNPLRFVYAEADAVKSSRAITALFAAHLERSGLPWEPIDLKGDSDHGSFTHAGIPTGGLFSGGIEPVSEEQAARFGATAGVPADPCSHRSCDTIENVDIGTLEELARAAAHVLVELAERDLSEASGRDQAPAVAAPAIDAVADGRRPRGNARRSAAGPHRCCAGGGEGAGGR